ncbi:CRISPR-associated endonuclease/helicase Cas3 [Sanguibacter gelidistatuariae]|uniref:CRISPR-associated endonuclease/helicase Cas3 n=1 Tax=Sanguibacter gelidistatuariae TaxID=1814289 RepID=A0A1G6JT10_9MICO|nr:HD domain-containing protein [Sanguibacter gelidistatuariae]SDC21146.1 CRISPR-associated endonuclease/helicase Cas3 [Sanguibacter gelidistatuariae]
MTSASVPQVFPTFAEFFAATHGGHAPYAWQSELASRLAGDGWPSVIEVPTGLGKTTTIAAAVYELARQCHARGTHSSDGSPLPLRTAPQRIFHVVNRRSLVDDTGDYVGALASAINDAVPGSTLAPLREALAGLLGEGSTIPVVAARIHGASPRGHSWLRSTGCTIVTLTPHQLVSRLVMRGFGVSNGARPIHAALVGIDRLVLVDEPHLAVPTIHTLVDAEALQRAATTDLGVPLGQTVLLGATVPREATRLVGATARSTLAIDPLPPGDPTAPANQDYARRLGAVRTLQVHRTSTASDTAFVKKLVTCAAAAWTEGNGRVAVMVNTVAVAQAVYAALPGALLAAKLAVPTTLVTSRFRPVDRPVVSRDDPGITVATQCLEVGVDVSFDALVTELCSWDALVQRLGRLNRDGSASQARAQLVSAPAGAVRPGTRAVYGDTLVALAAVLDDAGKDAVIDVSPTGLDALRMRAVALSLTLSAPVPRAGTLHRGLVPLMVQTRPTPVPDLPVDALVSGPDAPPTSEVLVAWRSQPSLLSTGADPVRAAEAVAISRAALLGFLAGEPATRVPVTDLETLAEEVAPGYDLARDRLSEVQVWDPQSESWIAARDLAAVADARRIVLPCSLGGYSVDRGWTGVADGAHTGDVSLAATLLDLRGLQSAGFTLPSAPVTLILTQSSISEANRLLGPCDSVDHESLAGALADASELLTAFPKPVGGGVDGLPDASDVDVFTEEAEARLREIGAQVVHAALGPVGTSAVPRVVVEMLTASAFQVTVRWRARTPDSNGGEVGLVAHQEQVAAWALSDATAAGTTPDLAHLLELAGRLHDEGKADPRFQRMLAGYANTTVSGGALVTTDNATGETRTRPLLAKSTGSGTEDTRSRRQSDSRRRREAGVPESWRHEGASIKAVPEMDGGELVRHLVGSHHGWYRPAFQPIAPDQDHGFAHASEFLRLNAEYGPWGLAYLETLLRLADWRASALPLGDVVAGVHLPDVLAPDTQHPTAQITTPSEFTHHSLTGLATHPLTGWFAVLGLLGAAEALGDTSARVRWDVGPTGGAPTFPVLECTVPLHELVGAVLGSPQWDDAQQRVRGKTGSKSGLEVKNQKLSPSTSLRCILTETENTMLLGLVGDLGRADRATSGGQVELPIAAFANNSSYPGVALRLVGALAPVDSIVAALFDPNAGYQMTACDGGMDRPLSAAPKDTGLGEVGDKRSTRALLAPLAVAGMALAGTTGAQPLGVNQRSRPARLRVPLPSRPTSLDELRALLVGAWAPDQWQWPLVGNAWVLELDKFSRGKSDISWQGRAVRRDGK